MVSALCAAAKPSSTSHRTTYRRLDGATADPHHAFLAALVADVAGDPILPREQVQAVRFGIVGPALLDRLSFFGQELELERADDRLRDLVLDREDVREVAVVAIGPD